jgi:hypothetical protein
MAFPSLGIDVDDFCDVYNMKYLRHSLDQLPSILACMCFGLFLLCPYTCL